MKNIIIADDEPYVLRIIKMALEGEGFGVQTACNGEEAYELVTQQHPDILITDVQMPKMTGIELCEKIEENINDRKFLICVLTSRTEVEYREVTSKIKNVTFLEKPVSIQNLIAKINSHVA